MNNLKIAICDANAQEAAFYADIMHEICEKTETLLVIQNYSRSNDFLLDMEGEAYFTTLDIIVVDPENGFSEIPGAVRERGYGGLILYLSHSRTLERYRQAFDVDAFNYIQKGSDPMRLERFRLIFKNALDAAHHFDRQYIVVNYVGEYRRIAIKDIFSFEAVADHLVSVEYSGGSFKFLSTLGHIEARLGEQGFIRVHRSYLVSISAIQTLGYDELTLKNGARIPRSRNYSTLKSAISHSKKPLHHTSAVGL